MSFLDSFKTLPAIEYWTRINISYVPEDMIEIYWKMAEPPNKRVLRLDIQVATTEKGADDNLISQVDRFELPGITQQADPGFGDKVFASETGFTILFSRNGLVILLRNVGSEFVPLWSVARAIDHFILGLPDPQLST
jgi:hypothetical protein